MDKRVLNSVFVVAIGLLAIVVILVLYNPTGNQQTEDLSQLLTWVFKLPTIANRCKPTPETKCNGLLRT